MKVKNHFNIFSRIGIDIRAWTFQGKYAESQEITLVNPILKLFSLQI